MRFSFREERGGIDFGLGRGYSGSQVRGEEMKTSTRVIQRCVYAKQEKIHNHGFGCLGVGLFWYYLVFYWLVGYWLVYPDLSRFIYPDLSRFIYPDLSRFVLVLFGFLMFGLVLVGLS